MFSLFYSVWSNPNSKIYQIVSYLLKTSPPNSRTWSVNLRCLSQKYGLPDPLTWLQSDPLEKSSFKEIINTKISSYFEKELREMATTNSRMKFFNVSIASLRGNVHPVLANMVSTYEVKKCRIHIKMLTGDYLTYAVKSKQSGGSPECRLCCSLPSYNEDIAHIITVCSAYSEIRKRILDEYFNLSEQIDFPFQEIVNNNETLCQFILDPTSMNLNRRLQGNNDKLFDFLKISRDYCFGVHETRMRLLNSLMITSC